MVANLWNHLPKYKLHLGEITSLRWVCEVCSDVHHGSIELLSTQKLPQMKLQLDFIEISHITIIRTTQELGNVAGPKVIYLIIHPCLIVLFIHFHQRVVELSHL